MKIENEAFEISVEINLRKNKWCLCLSYNPNKNNILSLPSYCMVSTLNQKKLICQNEQTTSWLDLDYVISI